MTTKSTSALDKYFEALTESYDAIIEAVKAGNERGYRVSNNLIAEAQKGQKEALDHRQEVRRGPHRRRQLLPLDDGSHHHGAGPRPRARPPDV